MRKKIIIKQLLSKIVILTTILARKCGNHLRRRAEKRGRKFCKRKESRSKNQNRSIESREAKQQSIHIQEQDHVYSHRFPYADTSHRFEEHVNRGRSRDNSFPPPHLSFFPSLPFPFPPTNLAPRNSILPFTQFRRIAVFHSSLASSPLNGCPNFKSSPPLLPLPFESFHGPFPR